MNKIDYLSQFDLMRSLNREDLIEMDELTSITPFPKKQLIQSPDTFTEKLYFIKKGKVRLYRLNAEGRQFTLDILSEGNIFGEMNGISLGTRDVFIETVEACDICMMDKERFERYLLQRPRFMLNMIQAISQRLAHMSALAQKLAIGRLHDKIIHILLKLSERFGNGNEDGSDFCAIGISLSHQELANLVGASREAVTLGLQELVEAGAIRTGFRTIHVNREKLSALLDA